MYNQLCELMEKVNSLEMVKYLMILQIYLN